MATRKRTPSSATASGEKSAAAGSRRKPAAPAERPTADGVGEESASPPKRGRAAPKARGSGKQLVIVESPSKAKTINKFLGGDFIVAASVGHVRDLPSKAPKGSGMPVPGVDLENDFRPTYEVLPGKKKTMTELKRAARDASEVWFATDLDREGEAIAWHLAEELGIDPAKAKRVIFNAITRSEIQRAFQTPHPIDQYKVNAQQARRILDRIVGYQVSPLLWKKVARGLSAGRVQSVAVRLIVDREAEIRAFVPDESWRVTARLTPKIAEAPALVAAWNAMMATRDERGAAPSQKAQLAWIAERGGVEAELVELGGARFELARPGRVSDDADAATAKAGKRSRKDATTPSAGLAAPATPDDSLDARVRAVAAAAGLVGVELEITADPEARGLDRRRVHVVGRVDPAARYRVRSVETKRTQSRPSGPFITSSLQVAASTALGFGADRTMRVAQSLYEGVTIPGTGLVGLITYMRTDSTHLSGEALREVRDYIGTAFGAKYLPEKPNFFGSANKQAQEAHEAIRPTDAARTPESLRGSLNEDQFKLYRLIWSRFVSCQMVPAEWDATAVLLERIDPAGAPAGAVLRATGRVLVFDGFYKASGLPASADEPTLPRMSEGDPFAPFSIDPEQRFSSPPPRYTEASLVKKLEEEGIGRPSTYAAIIRVIQDRGYVAQDERRFHATDLGMVVTEKLIEGFPQLMDVGYTREMEAELDKIEDAHTDWVDMLKKFYGPFQDALGHAFENMSHAKSETQPALFACPVCGRRTCYRFGKNGRFLSCTGYPECTYAAPIDRHGRPMLPERVDLVCPDDGSDMVLRTGRFGQFLASVNYPETRFVLNVDKKGKLKLPAPPPVVTDLACEKCGKPMNLRAGKRGPWLGCSGFPKCRGRLAWTKVDDAKRAALEAELAIHEKAHPQIVVTRRDGRVAPDGTPLTDLELPGGVQELTIHPEAAKEARVVA